MARRLSPRLLYESTHLARGLVDDRRAGGGRGDRQRRARVRGAECRADCRTSVARLQHGGQSRRALVESGAYVLEECGQPDARREAGRVLVRAVGQRRRCASDGRVCRRAAGDPVLRRARAAAADGRRRQHDLEADRSGRRHSGSSGPTPSADTCPEGSPPSRRPSTRCWPISCSA